MQTSTGSVSCKGTTTELETSGPRALQALQSDNELQSRFALCQAPVCHPDPYLETLNPDLSPNSNANAQVAARKEASDRFRDQVGDVMKEKGDLFDTMFEAEEKIRLGEAGWKERYYQVRRRYVLCCPCQCQCTDGPAVIHQGTW